MKRLHIYMLKQFIPLLLMTASICWFVVVMQFLWRYTDDFVGKGLALSTLMEAFVQVALMSLPTALPLGILLASLMTFGGLGERLELLAIKSAGVSLHRTMLPLIGIIVAISVGLFFYLNIVMMDAQVRFYQIAFSARYKQPDLEIPEGSFYNGISDYSIFVKKKIPKDRSLSGVLIYDISGGFDATRIIRADSGKLVMDASKTFLTLDLWRGESFQQLKSGLREGTENTYSQDVARSYFKEHFVYKQIVIPFDANFELQSDEGLRDQFVGKNLHQLTVYIQDTARYALDSIGTQNADLIMERVHEDRGGALSADQSKKEAYIAKTRKQQRIVPLDSVLASIPFSEAEAAMQAGMEQLNTLSQDAEGRFNEYDWQAYFYRTHDQERHRKFTFPVACLLFFFIGAPLGAIIRKGGIGTPMVVCVLIFIIYYMIDTYGYKMGYNGEWPVWIGMWLSSFVLLPLGVYLTIQAAKDSATLNVDAIVERIKSVFRPVKQREVTRRELIIIRTTTSKALEEVTLAQNEINTLKSNPFLAKGVFRHRHLLALNKQLRIANGQLNHMIDKLIDLDDLLVLRYLSNLPAERRYFSLLIPRSRALFIALLLFLPLSLPFILYLYKRKQKENKRIELLETTLKLIATRIEEINTIGKEESSHS